MTIELVSELPGGYRVWGAAASWRGEDHDISLSTLLLATCAEEARRKFRGILEIEYPNLDQKTAKKHVIDLTLWV
jgi:hypothetical protein